MSIQMEPILLTLTLFESINLDIYTPSTKIYIKDLYIEVAKSFQINLEIDTV